MYLLTAVFFAGSVFLSTNALKASSPTGVHVTLYKTELFADQTATGVQVFSDADGIPVDIVNNPDVFGEGAVAAGIYKRMKLTLKNEISFQGPDPCTPSNTINSTTLIDSTLAATDQVELYFATSCDGGGTGWTNSGTAASPFLMQNAIEVAGDATTVVKLIFNTANTLLCESGNANLWPPTINVVNYIEEPPVSACSTLGDYWIVNYGIFTSPIYDPVTGTIVHDPTLDQLLNTTDVGATWGTVTFSSPDPATHTGILQARLDLDYAHGGVSSHNEDLALSPYEPSGMGGNGYVSVQEPGSSGLTTFGTYILNGTRIVITMTGEDAGETIEGYFSSDCATLMAVNIAGIGSNGLLYGLKKPSSQPAFPGTNKYVNAAPAMIIQYNDANHRMDFMGSISNFGVMDGALDADIGWRAMFAFNPVYSSGTTSTITGMTSWGAQEEAGQSSIGSAFSISADGLITMPDSWDFAAIGENGNAVYSGETRTVDPAYGEHHVSAGFAVKLAPAVSLSDVVGTWKIGAFHSKLDQGSGDWGDGNESAEFGITYGDIIIDSAGLVSVNFTSRDAFSGRVSYESAVASGYIELHTECYKPGTLLTDTACTGGILIPVFHVKDNDAANPDYGKTMANFVLDGTKQVIQIWEPIDTNDIPETEDCGYLVTPATACTGANNHTVNGIAIKMP